VKSPLISRLLGYGGGLGLINAHRSWDAGRVEGWRGCSEGLAQLVAPVSGNGTRERYHDLVDLADDSRWSLTKSGNVISSVASTEPPLLRELQQVACQPVEHKGAGLLIEHNS
jgi:hypothetical protein